MTPTPGIEFNPPHPLICAAFLARIARVSAAAGHPATGREMVGLFLDVCAANGANGNPPLDFEHLLNCPRPAFLAALRTINSHIDRRTGELLAEPYKPAKASA